MASLSTLIIQSKKRTCLESRIVHAMILIFVLVVRV